MLGEKDTTVIQKIGKEEENTTGKECNSSVPMMNSEKNKMPEDGNYGFLRD